MDRSSAKDELGGPRLPDSGVSSNGAHTDSVSGELRDDRSRPAVEAGNRNAEAATCAGRAAVSFDAQLHEGRSGNDG